MISLSAIVEWVLQHGFWLVVSIVSAAIVVFFLERKVKRLEERIKALKEAATKFEESLEKEAIQPVAPGAPAVTPPTRNNWEDIRSHWRVVRDRLEELITEIDGRRQRTYDNTSRYSYKDVIDMLRDDKKINAHTATFLHSMNQSFLGLKRNARNTSDDAANNFIDRFKNVAGPLGIKSPPRAAPKGTEAIVAAE